MFDSILFNTDSYKVSMWKQYPPDTQYVYSYIEARGGRYDKTVLLGLQAFIRKYLEIPITAKEVAFADKFWTAHGEPFNREGWDYIVSKHKGLLPLQIKGLDEGSVVDVRIPSGSESYRIGLESFSMDFIPYSEKARALLPKRYKR